MNDLRLPLLLSSLLTLSCAEEQLVAIAGQLLGVICDAESGWPVDGGRLSVTVGDATNETRTDDEGAFLFPSLAEGEGSLHIDPRGEDRTAVVQISGTTIFEDPACRGLPGPPGTGGVRGQVCNRHTGDLITEADVKILLAEGESIGTTSDDQGRFLFDAVPAGEHVLLIEADGYTQSIPIDVLDGETTEVSLGECAAAGLSEGFVIGHMCDAVTGGPLQGADVLTFLADTTMMSDSTDLEGNFLIGPLAEGHVLVRVLREPDVARDFPVEVVAGTDVLVVNDEGCGDSLVPPGSITGSVCTPEGASAVSGADVWLELPDGERIETTTDSDGNFVLNGVPPGEYDVHIRAGVFDSVHHVVVDSSGSAAIPPEDCPLDDLNTKIAVVSGSYDDVGSVLIDVGIPAESIDTFDSYSWANELFGDLATLSEYDIVFINCGADEYDFVNSESLQSNLRQYIQAGGRLYASDWAYDIVEVTFPSFVDFYGDDMMRDSAAVGIEQTQAGTIIDADLAGALGASDVQLNYPLGSWAIVESVSDDVNIYIRGNAMTYDSETLPFVPHTLSFRVGDGRVTYSSFHQEPGINLQQEQILNYLMFML
jgi:hypothetical protein